MKQQLNEVKRMQKLAGILKESKLNENEIDAKALVRMISNAYREDKQSVTVNDEPVTMWVAMMGKIKTANTNYDIWDIVNGDAELKINGQPVEMPTYTPTATKPSTPSSPEDVAKWQDRFGPGGGYDTPAGRYTGD